LKFLEENDEIDSSKSLRNNKYLPEKKEQKKQFFVIIETLSKSKRQKG